MLRVETYPLAKVHVKPGIQLAEIFLLAVKDVEQFDNGFVSGDLLFNRLPCFNVNPLPHILYHLLPAELDIFQVVESGECLREVDTAKFFLAERLLHKLSHEHVGKGCPLKRQLRHFGLENAREFGDALETLGIWGQRMLSSRRTVEDVHSAEREVLSFGLRVELGHQVVLMLALLGGFRGHGQLGSGADVLLARHDGANGGFGRSLGSHGVSLVVRGTNEALGHPRRERESF